MGGLNSCSPGLAANAAQVTIQLVQNYTDLSQDYLKQQYNQAHMGSEGVKGSVQFTRASLEAASEGTSEEATGQIESGALGIGGQAAGYARARRLNTQIEGNQAKLGNVDNAIQHLEAGVAGDPMLAREDDGAPAVPDSSFKSLFVDQQGFKYGDPVEAPRDGEGAALGKNESALRKAPNAVQKREALDAAKEAKSNFQNQVDKLQRDQESSQQLIASLGQSSGAIAGAAGSMKKATKQNEQAQNDAGNVSARYLSDSAQASNNVASGGHESAKQHVAQVLQNAGSLAEVDNMRA